MANRMSAKLRGDRPLGKGLTIWGLCILVLLTLLVTILWLKTAPQQKLGSVSLMALRASYARILPGETQTRDLAGLGFDVTRLGVKRLSYLSLMEAFARRDSNGFDRLDTGAGKC